MSETPFSPDPADPSSEAPTQPSPTSEPPPAPRRLLRSRDDRVIGGVCGGLARYFGIDPLIVRIAAVALVFVGGAALIAYLAALALVPEDDGHGQPARERPSRAATIAGAVLVVLAALALTDGWGWHGGWLHGTLVTAAVLGVVAFAGHRLLTRRGSEDQPAAMRIATAALTLCAALVAAVTAMVGSAWATAVGGGAIVAGVVIALGLAMVVLSLRHRNARWLAIPALVLALPAATVAAADIDVRGGLGERTRTPVSVADLAPQYRLGAGQLVVDLRRMAWPTQGAPVSLKVRVGAGHALVLVGSDVCVEATSHVSLGFVGVLGEESSGFDVDDRTGSVARWTGKKLLLDADVGAGALEVRHERVHHGPGGDPDAIAGDLAAAGCAGRTA